MSARSPSLTALGLVLLGYPAGAAWASAAEADGDDAELEIARSLVEHDIALMARERLERLYAKKTYEHRDEVTLLLARCRFRLRRFDAAAKLLRGYEKTFPESRRFFLEAAYWLARADLERAGAETGPAREKLLKGARKAFERVLDESAEPRLLEGSRFFVGAVFFEAGAYAEALSAFRRARKLGIPYSETEGLSLYVGRTHLKLRDFGEAAREFGRFIEYFPKSRRAFEAHYGLGEAHYYQEKWEQAGDAYERSREAAERAGNADAAARSRYARGWAFAKLGEERARERKPGEARTARTEALSEFESLLRHPDAVLRGRSVLESGKLLFALGRFGEAAERLLPLTDPSAAAGPAGGEQALTALYYLGRSRIRLEQYPEAVTALERALEAGPEGELERRTRYALAAARVRNGDPEGAQRELEPLAREDRSPFVRAEARFEMARVAREAAGRAMARNRPGLAAAFYAQAFDRCLELAGDPAALAELPADEVAYWRGRSADDRARLESGESAEDWFEKALSAYAAVRRHAGWNKWAERSLAAEAAIHAKRGALDRAVAAYGELLSHEDVSPEVELEARLRLADAELELGRPGAAREALVPVLEREDLVSGRPEAAYKASVALSRQEEGTERAIEGFQAVARDHPRSGWAPYALAGLGDCRARLGRHAEAARAYERILSEYAVYAGLDRAELAAGDARRLAGETEAALAHYRSLFMRGRSDGLRARARLEEARIEFLAGRSKAALDRADEALATARKGRTANEAEDLRGRILLSLRRHEEAVSAFARASADDDAGFRARAKAREAGALLAWGRSPSAGGPGTPARPADVLRRSARAFTEAFHLSAEAGLRDEAAFGAADALWELAAVDDAGGRSEQARLELEDARKILERVSDDSGSRRDTRIEEIEGRLESIGR